MAKKLFTYGFDKDGKPVAKELGKVGTRGQKKSESTLIPWTAGPQTRWQKVARALKG